MSEILNGPSNDKLLSHVVSSALPGKKGSMPTASHRERKTEAVAPKIRPNLYEKGENHRSSRRRSRRGN